MSETLTETPPGAPESLPSGYEHFPNPEGSEAGAVGGGEHVYSDEGGSPGLETKTPEQQAQTLPPGAEQASAPEQQAAVATQPQTIPAKEDELRFEHWQSQANKLQGELDEIKGSQVHAIAQYIQRTPEMLDIVEEGLAGGPVTKPRAIPEKPVRPQKPDNYSSPEAHDPETVSGRYRASLDDYLEKKDIYNDAREERRTVQAQRDSDKAQLAEIKAGLVREGGLNEIEANEAMSVLFSRESMNPVTLSKLYRLMKSPSQDQIANQEKARQLLAQKPGLESPPPLAVAGGETPPNLTPDQEMAASMKAHTTLRGKLR